MFEFSIFWFALYFVPSIIVIIRKSHNIGPVIVVNLFLGWTFIGWIVALAMAVSQNKKKDFVQNNVSWSPPKGKAHGR